MCYVSANVDFFKIDSILLSIPPKNTFPHRSPFMWPSPPLISEEIGPNNFESDTNDHDGASQSETKRALSLCPLTCRDLWELSCTQAPLTKAGCKALAGHFDDILGDGVVPRSAGGARSRRDRQARPVVAWSFREVNRGRSAPPIDRIALLVDPLHRSEETFWRVGFNIIFCPVRRCSACRTGSATQVT